MGEELGVWGRSKGWGGAKGVGEELRVWGKELGVWGRS